MRVGFTGTQDGMTMSQRVTLIKELLMVSTNGEFNHGDCIGADAEAHIEARELGFFITKHPPKNTSKQAFCVVDKTLVPKDYIERNHDIVDATEMLIATPKGMQEELRSGTWATVRYARKLHRPIIIIWPNGTTTKERLLTS